MVHGKYLSAFALSKLPLRFSDSLVLRQLRYTGMLETVLIRQSGYSSKFTFQVNLLSLLPFCLYCSKQLVHSAQCFFFFIKWKKNTVVLSFYVISKLPRRLTLIPFTYFFRSLFVTFTCWCLEELLQQSLASGSSSGGSTSRLQPIKWATPR